MKLTKEEPSKEEIAQAIERLMNGEGELVYKEKKTKKHDYDFSKVNLKNLYKKHLIRIIYDLKERLDMYETN